MLNVTVKLKILQGHLQVPKLSLPHPLLRKTIKGATGLASVTLSDRLPSLVEVGVHLSHLHVKIYDDPL